MRSQSFNTIWNLRIGKTPATSSHYAQNSDQDEIVRMPKIYTEVL
jgi:hypothetical protein